MKLSIFWIGVIITAIGISWISGVYWNNNKQYSEFFLDVRESHIQELFMYENDLGYYKILVQDLKDSTFVQVINPQGNIISDKKIDTRMSVNYFDVRESGMYSIKITNTSDHQFSVNSEIGNTNSSKMISPGIIILVGMIIVVISSLYKLRNYKIAQPDENSS